ncbi:MFS transporter [Naasia aerilata]|uniref:MFS transporter n=1 Tax=Naasia aerilata TaxID=1162966 RepID=A0ABM8G9A4_9MICO|nr:MFS transporter [Naasia aerilata]BDZ44706.1 MFS transporter [Naasia aerilata]
MSGTGRDWPRRLALLVAAAFFMENLDATVLATAAPAIASSMGVQPADVGVAMSAYLLAVATFIPASGWLAGRLGSKRTFTLAVLLFTLASVACALSGSLLLLTLSRVAQGIAGSMMVPVGRLLVLGRTEKADLLKAVAYLTWPALLAPVLGPFLGGVITEYAGWPWVFLVNVPIGVALFGFALRVVPRDEPQRRESFDVRGFVAVTTALGALVLGLELLAHPATVLVGVLLILAAGILGVLAVHRLRRVPSPFLDLAALRLPTFRVSNSSGALFRAAVFSAPFLLPLLLQDGFGWSPVAAGAMVLWLFVGNVAIKPVTSPLLRRVGFAPVMIGSGIGLALAFVAVALLGPGTPALVLAAVFLASGVFRSLGFTAYNTIQFADVPAPGMRHANTLSETVAQLASGVGIATAAVAVRILEAVLPGGGALPAYRGALAIMAVVALVSVAGAAMLPHGSADALRVRRERPATARRPTG